MYMDNINIFVKNINKNLDSYTNNKNIQPWFGREFGIENCAMLIMKNKKRDITEK